MSTSSSNDQPTSANPYKAPNSAASPFAKSYLTLAVCSGLAVLATLGGIWIYAQTGRSSSTTYERPSVAEVDDRVIHRAVEFVDRPEPIPQAIAPAPANTSEPTAP